MVSLCLVSWGVDEACTSCSRILLRCTLVAHDKNGQETNINVEKKGIRASLFRLLIFPFPFVYQTIVLSDTISSNHRCWWHQIKFWVLYFPLLLAAILTFLILYFSRFSYTLIAAIPGLHLVLRRVFTCWFLSWSLLFFFRFFFLKTSLILSVLCFGISRYFPFFFFILYMDPFLTTKEHSTGLRVKCH